MHRILLTLATLALGAWAVTGPVSAQSPDPVASPESGAPVTTTLEWVTLGTEDVTELNTLVPGGYRLGYRSHGQTRSDDPRLVGEFRDVTLMDVTMDSALARYAEVVRIETADGAWQGSGTGHISAADGREVALLTLAGEGAYDGMSVLLVFDGPAMERHSAEYPDTAVIWPGPAPEVPDPSLMGG